MSTYALQIAKSRQFISVSGNKTREEKQERRFPHHGRHRTVEFSVKFFRCIYTEDGLVRFRPAVGKQSLSHPASFEMERFTNSIEDFVKHLSNTEAAVELTRYFFFNGF